MSLFIALGHGAPERGEAATMAESSTRPVLFVVDHEPLSSATLVQGLTRRFGGAFTVPGESTPAAALGAL